LETITSALERPLMIILVR